MAAFEIIALNEATPQLRAPGVGDTYSVPRPLSFAGDMFISRYAAKQLMISGDGVGATTNAGLIFGYLSSPYGAIWGSSTTPTATNYALKTYGTETAINGGSGLGFNINDVGKFSLTATLNTSINPLSITDTTASASTTTGALKVAGGAGIVGKLYVGDDITEIKASNAAINIRNSAETAGLNTYIMFGSSTYNRAQLRSTASGTQGGDLTLLTAPSGGNPIERITVSADGVTTFYGSVSLTKTITAPGTTGNQTINKTTGRVNFAAGATSLVVTNSLVDANSIIICNIAANDATASGVKAVAGAGSFTIYLSVGPTAECPVDFHATN